MSDVNARAARGIRSLMGRMLVVQVMTFGAGIVLARSLTPAQFGLYFIATFFVSTFGMFADLGFGPSLIQQGKEIHVRELRVSLTLQLAATAVVVGLLAVAGHWVARLYPHASHATVWLIRVLALQLFLTAFRSMSVLQLERDLRYGRVAAIEVVEAVAYQGVAVGLAVAGLGVWSFAIAVLVRGVAGTTIAFAMSPWRVGFAFDRRIARDLLRFGVPFQLSSIVQQAGGWLTPVLVGSLSGPGAVGFLGWASSNARKPLMLVDNVMRVAFPHFARLQHDRWEVERVLSQYLRVLLLASGLWVAEIIVAAPGLVPAIYGGKWLPAIPSLMVFAVALWFDTLAWLLATTLSSLGSVGLVARVNTLRTAVYIGLGVTLILLFGFVGVPIAALVSVAAMTPPLLRGFGPGSARRLLLPLAGTLLPLGAGVAAGLGVGLLPLSEPGRSVAAAVVCLGVYLAAALALKLVGSPRSVKAIARGAAA
jgi:PST family polysaccharide transporter